MHFLMKANESGERKLDSYSISLHELSNNEKETVSPKEYRNIPT